MADKTELLRLPKSDSNSLIHTVAGASLIARGRREAASLMMRKPEPKLLAAVCLDGKWGFIDKSGEFAVESKYCGVLPFSCGLAAFTASPVPDARADFGRAETNQINGKDSGLFGYLDLGGKIAISPRFRSVRNFREGLAGVEIDGKWGFIHTDGKIAVEPRFPVVYDFKDGIARVHLHGGYFNHECGFIDDAGKFVIEPRFDTCRDFSEGLAAASINDNDKVGYIDRNGTFVIQPQFYQGFDFRDGVAHVISHGRPSLIDKTGRILYQYEECGAWTDDDGFTDGIVRVHDMRDPHHPRPRYVDMKLRPIIEDPSLMAVHKFSEGLGEVYRRVRSDHSGMVDSLHGYVGMFGEVKIEPQFDSASLFRNGLARVALRVPNDDLRGLHGYKYCFIDKGGQIAIETRFEWASDFNNEIAQAREKGQKWGYINVAGEIIIPCQFDEVRDFQQITT